MSLDLSRLDEGNGIEAAFKERSAKWHKSCYMKFNITKLKRAEKRKPAPGDSEPNLVVPAKRVRVSRSKESKGTCFFCEGTSEPLRAAATFQLDDHVRQCAVALQDGKLLAKLSAGDMIAQEAKYHPLCLASLYKKAKLKPQDDPNQDDDKINHGIALAELLGHIEDVRIHENVAPVQIL